MAKLISRKRQMRGVRSIMMFGVALLGAMNWGRPAEIRTSDEPGELIDAKGKDGARYHPAGGAETVAKIHQKLGYGDRLRTLKYSKATVLFEGQTQDTLDSLTELLIIRRSPTNAPGARILKGNLYVIHRNGPDSMPIETPLIAAVPKGTEFSVSVDPETGESVFTMFDGEVLLQREGEERRVSRGFQGIVTSGKPIVVRPILQAENLIQWWIHYPGILDTAELDVTKDPAFAESLRAYRAGDLRQAFESFPGGPEQPNLSAAPAAIYHAALLLGVGDVRRAEELLRKTPADLPAARALRTMLDAVAPSLTTNSWRASLPAPRPGESASELLAISYAHQATNNLEAALAAARHAVEHSPAFGFGWARVAELEFSHGHTAAARAAVAKALELSPLNAQAHAMHGFLLAAAGRHEAALVVFERAIEIDSSLANGWLGRGLVRIRMGDAKRGRDDLRMAASVEPSRSLIRSYAGKAFADAGRMRLARQELDQARHLDANDPTPWLYSALASLEQNRVNEAVTELERSIALNDNRALFRSQLLLDADRAVRGANLARVYERAGLATVGFNEAARAVSHDPANFSAHQFLSDSFNTLRDPARFNLRYETPWFGEMLLANLLSPVGATPLSQNISQQEYSRLFERDRVGLSSDTTVRSDGQVQQLASHFGNLGSSAWALDLDYQHNNGVRPNNKLDRIEWYSTFKHQLTPQDSLLLLFKYQDYSSGDNFQYYDARRSLDRDFNFEEKQRPIAIAGFHHEWGPGVHTLLLGGRLENDQRVTDPTALYPVILQNPGSQGFNSYSTNALDFANDFEAAFLEGSQLFQTPHHTWNLGVRYQDGSMTARSRLLPNAIDPLYAPLTNKVTEASDRFTAYAYHHWRALDSLQLIGGVAYDHVTYPRLLRGSPVIEGEREKDMVAPKLGAIWNPLDPLTLRAAYTRSLGGVTLDQSYRLEPTHIAGFVQTYRTLFPISLTGPVSAQEFETADAALEWKLPQRTYLTIQWERVASKANHTRGALVSDASDPMNPLPAEAAGLREKLNYLAHSLDVNLSRLVGEEWTVGMNYRFERAELHSRFPTVTLPDDRFPANEKLASDLHAGGVFAIFNHASGIFAHGDLTWYAQYREERSFDGGRMSTREMPNDIFPMLNLAAGWRFPRQHGDMTVGVLNATDDSYKLSPVNFYNEMPHERVFFGRLRFRF